VGFSELIVLATAVLVSAVIGNGVGIGSGIFLVPVLTLVLPSKLALGIGAPAMLISDIVGLRYYWKEWEFHELKRLVPMGILGVFSGGYLIDIIPSRYFQFGIGIVAVGFACFQLYRSVRSRRAPLKASDKPHYVPSRSWSRSVFFGYLAGLASTMAHAGGMVMSIYMLQADTPKRRFVGTFVIFSFATNLIKLFTYSIIGILSGDMVTWMAALAPLIICGGLFGNFLNHRIPQELFRNLIMVFILAIGLWVASTA
jgi:uncharacterized membrane protein YfcA